MQTYKIYMVLTFDIELDCLLEVGPDPVCDGASVLCLPAGIHPLHAQQPAGQGHAFTGSFICNSLL